MTIWDFYIINYISKLVNHFILIFNMNNTYHQDKIEEFKKLLIFDFNPVFCARNFSLKIPFWPPQKRPVKSRVQRG